MLCFRCHVRCRRHHRCRHRIFLFSSRKTFKYSNYFDLPCTSYVSQIYHKIIDIFGLSPRAEILDYVSLVEPRRDLRGYFLPWECVCLCLCVSAALSPINIWRILMKLRKETPVLHAYFV